MGKLAVDSEARGVLERHIYHTTLAIEAADRMRDHFRPSTICGVAALINLSVAAVILTAVGGRKGQKYLDERDAAENETHHGPPDDDG